MTDPMPAPRPVPFVSVVMPVRDEEDAIVRSVGAVAAQDHPHDRMEILVVDGMSSDRTRALVEEIAGRDPRVRLLDNPGRTAPTAMNVGLAAMRGDVMVRVDGHCEVPPDHVRRCVEMLLDTGAWCAGGAWRTVGRGRTGRVLAEALSSRWGVGSATYRTGADTPRAVDTLAFGGYPRWVFERIGGFDEELVRNQDDELNFRLVQAGGTIWMDPTLVADYTCRPTLAATWRQFSQYGEYKVRVMQKRGGAAAPRHLVPATLVLGLAATTGLAALTRRARLLALGPLPYLAGLLAASWPSRRRLGRDWLRLPAALATLHLSYGTGFLKGIWRWRAGFLARPPGPPPAELGPTHPDAVPVPEPDDAAPTTERERIEATYAGYQTEETEARWSRDNPGNRRALDDRDRLLRAAARRWGVDLDAAVRVLDIGCGRADALAELRAGDPPGSLGMDLLADRLRGARTAHPDIPVARADATSLPVADASLDAVVCSTLFSSVLDDGVRRAIAAEITRVLRPGGVVLWYDLRRDNPSNPSVAGVTEHDLAALFPGWVLDLTPTTLVPPLARRLGPATPALYPALAVGPLRTHLAGALVRRGR